MILLLQSTMGKSKNSKSATDECIQVETPRTADPFQAPETKTKKSKKRVLEESATPNDEKTSEEPPKKKKKSKKEKESSQVDDGA